VTEENTSAKRTRDYIYQIKGAFVFKVVGVAASFLYLPLMIRYLGLELFGIWTTLLSVMSWVLFFDLGVGSGVRNKVAEALGKNDRKEARNYVASGYTLIGILAAIVWIMAMVTSSYVSWQTTFNTSAVSESTLRSTVQIALSFFLLNFWIGLIGAVLSALQKISMVALCQMMSNIFALVFVFLLTKNANPSLPTMASIYGTSLILANMLMSIWFYKKHGYIRPCFYLDRMHIKPLVTLGVQFFLIQIAVLVIFATDKLLITQIFGPEYVVQYEVVFKLFSVITFIHALISAPLWSAYTDAIQRCDAQWIHQMLNRQKKIYVAIVAASMMLALCANNIIEVWIGEGTIIPASLISSMLAFVLISTWNNIYAMFINGVGKLKVQLYTAVVGMLINIPLALFFTKGLGIGVSGVVIATCVSLGLASLMLPLQTRYILRALNKVA
jgi:O-antigen/teichoic acid export membrane protein